MARGLPTTALLLTLGLLAGSIAMAQSRDDAPSIGSFDGTDSLSFPAELSLVLGEVASIELWVKPTWDEDPGYDPALLSALGPDGVRYAVVMSAAKDAIGLYSGPDWDYVEFDFSDGRLHHVAFVVLGDLTDVYIDGEPVDSIAQGIANVPITTFHVGSLNGLDSAFIGELAGVRIWDTALDGDDIAAYRQDGIFSAKGLTHPDFQELVGVTDFADGARTFILMNNEDSLEELVDAIDTGGGSGDIDPEFEAELDAIEPDPDFVPEPEDPEAEALFEQFAAAAAAAAAAESTEDEASEAAE